MQQVLPQHLQANAPYARVPTPTAAQAAPEARTIAPSHVHPVALETRKAVGNLLISGRWEGLVLLITATAG